MIYPNAPLKMPTFWGVLYFINVNMMILMMTAKLLDLKSPVIIEYVFVTRLCSTIRLV